MDLVLNVELPEKIVRIISKNHYRNITEDKRSLLSSLLCEYKSDKDVKHYFRNEKEYRFFDNINIVLMCFNYSFVNRDNKYYGINMKLLAVGLIFSNIISNTFSYRGDTFISIVYTFMNYLIQKGMTHGYGLQSFCFDFKFFLRDHGKYHYYEEFPSLFKDLCEDVQILYIKKLERSYIRDVHVLPSWRLSSLLKDETISNEVTRTPLLMDGVVSLFEKKQYPYMPLGGLPSPLIEFIPPPPPEEVIPAPPPDDAESAPVLPLSEKVTSVPESGVEKDASDTLSERHIYNFVNIENRLRELVQLNTLLTDEIRSLEEQCDSNKTKLHSLMP